MEGGRTLSTGMQCIGHEANVQLGAVLCQEWKTTVQVAQPLMPVNHRVQSRVDGVDRFCESARPPARLRTRPTMHLRFLSQRAFAAELILGLVAGGDEL